jgi:osmotically-inducible protein OsmY
MKTNENLRQTVQNAIENNWEVPDELVEVKVENGWVTLEGETKWNFQRDAVKEAVNKIAGVMGIHNLITVKSPELDIIEKGDIERALTKSWSVNDKAIQVRVANNHVTLGGTVNSWFQKYEAERIAWNALGVWNVENELAIEYAL